MNHDFSSSPLQQLLTEWTEQNRSLQAVHAALGELPPHALVQLNPNWSAQFEAATEVSPPRAEICLSGLRA
jgi:hypothetical protein